MAVAQQKDQTGVAVQARGAGPGGRAQAQRRARLEPAGLSGGWLALLRVAQGLVMARLAYVLAFHGGWDAFGNASALIPSIVQGPVGELFTSIYGNPVALWLIILGAAAVAAALITGLLVRLGAAVGALMTLSFYLAGLPPADGWFNLRLLYLIGLVLLAVGGAGRTWGIDSRLDAIQERWPWVRWIAG